MSLPPICSVLSQYGNESIYLNYGTGTLGGTLTFMAAVKTLVASSDELLWRLSEPLTVILSAQIAASKLHLWRQAWQ